MDKKLNLAILFGGPSGEHDVSLSSARGIVDALDKERYEIIPIAITREGKWLLGNKGKSYLLASKASRTETNSTNRQVTRLDNFTAGKLGQPIDLILPIGHGPFVEDGKLQGMLDMLGIPYLFSGTLASALAMHKSKTKTVAQNIGLSVLPEVIVKAGAIPDSTKIVEKLSLPLVVKPTGLGSSIGITIAKTQKELQAGIKSALAHTDEVMVEKYQLGRELTVGVMGNKNPRPLPVVEIIPEVSNFYDYQAKYDENGSRHICPARIPAEITARVQAEAVKIFTEVGCADLARADFIWDEESGKIYFLEVNTIPGMTPTSLVPEAAKAEGMDFGEFLGKLIAEKMKSIG